MVQLLEARGKATGHAARARRRAERAIAEGREPGKAGRPKPPRCGGCNTVLIPGMCCGSCVMEAWGAGERDFAPFMAPMRAGAR